LAFSWKPGFLWGSNVVRMTFPHVILSPWRFFWLFFFLIDWASGVGSFGMKRDSLAVASPPCKIPPLLWVVLFGTPCPTRVSELRGSSDWSHSFIALQGCCPPHCVKPSPAPVLFPVPILFFVTPLFRFFCIPAVGPRLAIPCALSSGSSYMFFTLVNDHKICFFPSVKTSTVQVCFHC